MDRDLVLGLLSVLAAMGLAWAYGALLWHGWLKRL
jgi:hypothetical protein